MTTTPKGKSKREQILEAAEKVFEKKGFLASSVGDIIKALGTSSGAVYHHFPTKKSILKAIAERSVVKLENQMVSWAEDTSLTPGEKVRSFLAVVASRRHLRLSIDRLNLGLAREDREMHELVVKESLERLTDQLRLLIEAGNASGEFQVAHPKAAAITLLLLLSDFMHRAGQIETMVPHEEMDASLVSCVERILGMENA